MFCLPVKGTFGSSFPEKDFLLLGVHFERPPISKGLLEKIVLNNLNLLPRWNALDKQLPPSTSLVI